nr:reverse transcriptase domain-containing protein [Tanacetum cinerariifolium]
MSFPQPIIILFDSDVDDTFSSTHSPDNILASPDYFPASSGNTFSNFLDDLTKDLLASLSLSPFYDDPYMKVVQAYDATNNELPILPLQAPIAPPTILPPSLVLSLSPMFDSLDFLPPEKISPKDTETSESLTSISPYLSIGSSLPVSNFTEDCKVKFATGTLTEDALSWWNSYAKPIGIEQVDKIVWTELKRLLTNKYCPCTEVKKMEDEFYNLVVKGNDLKTYIRRFQELATLCPTMVPNFKKLMEVFIEGLPRSIEGNVTASKP